MPLPACEAVIVQEPAPVSATVVPLTVQLPLAANDTVRPEVAVALTVKLAAPKVLLLNGPKLIVWLAWLIVNCALFDVPPAGPPLKTVTFAVPEEAIKVEVIVAVNCDAET